MKQYTKRLMSLLLSMILLLSCMNIISPGIWAEDNQTAKQPEEANASVVSSEAAAPEDEGGEAEGDPVANVIALLAQIDSLAEMQYYRVTVTRDVFRNASGGYSSGNYEKRPEQHQEAQRRYRQYLDDMFAKRAAAKEAYDALTEEQKAELAADETAAANLAKLTPYDELPTGWLTSDKLIVAQTAQTAEQLQFPAPITPTTDPTNPYVYEFIRAYELSMTFSEAGFPGNYALVDSSTSGDSWMPSGFYEYGNSNYEVAYCCDTEYNAHRGTHYKRINLEDAEYYTDEEASHIRSIIEHAYPYLTIEEMKQFLISQGFDADMANALTRSDMLAAVQLAVWSYSNYQQTQGQLRYQGTCPLLEARDRRDYVMLPSLHDYRNEDWTWYLIAPGDYYTGYYRWTYYEEIEQRVNALTQFLCDLPGTAPKKSQIVITDVQIARTALSRADDDSCRLDLNVFLNRGAASFDDNIFITTVITSEDGTSTETRAPAIPLDGHNYYSMSVTVRDGDTITVIVDGTQDLEKGAYYYEAQGGPENSQSMVGVAEGRTRIYAEASFVFRQEGNMGLRIYKTAAGTELPISDIGFRVYRVNPAEGETIGEVPTAEEIEQYAVEEKLVGTMTTDETGYAFQELERGTYLVVEVLNPEKVRETVDPFYVTVPKPVEVTDENGETAIAYEHTVPFDIENIPLGSVPAGLEVTKQFNDWGKAESFTFQLAAVTQGAPLPKQTTAAATEEAPVASFGRIVFNDAGVYEYTITEIDDGVDGVTYDTEPHRATVTVTENEDHELVAQVSYDGADSLTVTNTFTPATAAIELTKEFNDWGKAASFTFELAAVTEGAPLPDETTATATEAAPVASFGTLSFDKAGTYVYTITEINDGVEGVVYDTEPHTATVTVTKGEKNALSAQVSYDDADALTVVNTYAETQAEIEVTKQLSGRDWTEDDRFVFHLAPVSENAPAPAADTAAATKELPTVSFGTLTFTKPGTYEYKLWEEKGTAANVTYDTREHKVVITVTRDEETKALSAVVTYDGAASLTVKNTYAPPPPPDSPKTGDSSLLLLWAALAAASGLGLILLLWRRRRYGLD